MNIIYWGINLIIFILPLYLLRFKIFGIPTTALEISIYLVFLIWLAKGVYRKFLKKFAKENKWLLLGILLLIIGVTVSTLFSSNIKVSAGIWKGWFIDPILFFVLVASTIKTPAQIKTVLLSYFSSGFLVSFISFFYLAQKNLDPVGRLQVFYNSPNYLAMYLAPAFIIGIYFLIFNLIKKEQKTDKSFLCIRLFSLFSDSPVKELKFFITTGLLFLFVALFFTQSFGAWIGILYAIGFGLFIYLLKSKKTLALVVLGFILITSLILVQLALIQKYSSLEARLLIWQKAIEIFKKSPILGIGPGTFENYFPPYPIWGVPQPHNIFLAFLLQTGIIGFIGFILVLIWFFKNAFRKTEKDLLSKIFILDLLLISVMTYILTHGLVDTTYWKNDLSIIFWFLIALMTVKRKI